MAPEPLIAIVDDDGSVRDALASLLGACGYRIDAYGSGRDLLAGGKLGEYEGFILDVQMPGIDGLQLQKRIVEAGIAAPIIFLTSSNEAATCAKALAMGAAAFLSKPSLGTELLVQLARALGLGDG